MELLTPQVYKIGFLWISVMSLKRRTARFYLKKVVRN